MVATQLRRANFFKKLLIGVGIFFIVIFLSGGNSDLSSKHWPGGGSVPSWYSTPISIDGNTELATFCSGNGTGSPGNPYFITYVEINGTSADGAAIYINNTSAYLVIENCTVQGANGEGEIGILVNNCTNVVIKNCIANDNFLGILFSFVERCSIEDSIVTSSSYAGIGVANSSECNVTSNVVIDNAGFGIGIVSSNTIQALNNNVSLNSNVGIAGQNMTDSVIAENEIKDNTNFGVYFLDSDDNNVTENVISGIQTGIYISAPSGPARSERNQISENNVTYNTNYGILLERANENEFFLNNFIGNAGGQARVVTPSANNHWNKTSLGNYWADYQSRYPTANNDGIMWDLPYIIPNLYIIGSVDRDYHAIVQPVRPNHYAPTLTGDQVLPAVGNTTTMFWFTVIYTDADNNYPIKVNVVVNSVPYPMPKYWPSDNTYTDGCTYQVGMYLPAGMNSYFFECADTKYTNTTIGYGISVTGNNTNSPTLSGGTVFPAHGLNGTTLFDFSVVYTDADNNAPTFVQVVLDWGSTLALTMTKEDAFETSYLDGCKYILNTTLPGVGNYTYYFTASDGFNNGISSTYSGIEIDLTYPIAIPGMVYGWTGWISYAEEPIAIGGTEVFGAGPTLFTVVSAFPTGTGTRTVNATSRVLTAGTQFRVGSHEPIRIFTDVVAGRAVPVSVWGHDFGDQDFMLVENVEILAANRLFKCWKMQSAEGSIAFFDMHSGFLVNGTFVTYAFGGIAHYSIQITGASASLLAPNSNAPSLSGYPASPSSGNQNTLFTFQVIYTDADNLGPVSLNLTINGTHYAMQKQNLADTNYVDGCTYVFSTYLQPGSYLYNYSVTDGVFSDVTGTYPAIQVNRTNVYAPTLTGGSMAPSIGYANVTMFLYSVSYTDGDNNAPQYINVTINSTIYQMVKQDAGDNNYVDGVIYVLSKKLPSVGTYTYRFTASDGTTAASTSTLTGPAVQTPMNISFDGMQYNYTRATFLAGYATLSNESEIHHDLIGNGIFNITSTWVTRAVNGTTREFPQTYGGFAQGYFYAGSHEFTRIFINVQLGSHVFVSVIQQGDQDFTITGTTVLRVMNRPFNCWVMSSAQGSVAYYDQFSGVLVNGTFYYSILGTDYKYSIQVRGTNIPLAPNAHFPDMINVNVLPASGNQSTTFDINATYIDLDGNASAVANIIFDGTTYPMTRINASDTNYTDGVDYTWSVSLLQPGSYTYSFNCSDGEFSGATADYTLVVSLSNLVAPALTSPGLSPPATPASPAPYTFRITYADGDNNAPVSINVTINGTAHAMTKQTPSDMNFIDGCVFEATVPLAPGSFVYNFSCADSAFTNSTGDYSMTVNVFAPRLVSASSTPPSSSVGPASVTLMVTYIDTDNNAPLYVNVTVNGVTHAMVKVNPSDTNYVDGVQYSYTISLEIGTYSCSFSATDAVFTASGASYTMVLSAPIPWDMILIVAGVGAGVIIIVGAIAANKKNKGKKASVPKKQKAAPQTREKAVKKLPDVSAPADTSVPSPLQFEAISTVTLGRYQCPNCAKEFKFQVADLSQHFSCPDCNQPLLRLVVCTKCGKPMSITQENFPQYVGKELQCPDCKNVFKV